VYFLVFVYICCMYFDILWPDRLLVSCFVCYYHNDVGSFSALFTDFPESVYVILILL
jgi:hypothetical protein